MQFLYLLFGMLGTGFAALDGGNGVRSGSGPAEGSSSAFSKFGVHRISPPVPDDALASEVDEPEETASLAFEPAPTTEADQGGVIAAVPPSSTLSEPEIQSPNEPDPAPEQVPAPEPSPSSAPAPESTNTPPEGNEALEPAPTSSETQGSETTSPQSTPDAGAIPEASTEPALAFAGADGFGDETIGGRGGEVLKVTNLNDSGEGSLRWALEDVTGPRIVVFEVGGVIELQSEIEINNPFVTVAGQTALGEGITLTGARIQVDASEVIIRGLKLRPGDGEDGQEFSSRDGISIGSGENGDPISNIIIDHNSIAWATDENAAIWGNVSDVTFSNNIIAQGLETPTELGRSSMGMLVSGGDIENISILRNFFAHNEDRNPYFRDVDNVEVANNYIYNYGPSGLRLSNEISANLIGNVFEAGVDSPERAPVYLRDDGHNASAYYLEDNLWLRGDDALTGNDVAHTDTQFIQDNAIFDANFEAMSSSEVKDYVLANAGAMPWSRDAIDDYFVRTALDGTGSVIDTSSEAGVQLTQQNRSDAYLDSDNDGMPDWFESWYAPLDPHVADANGDSDGDGYTNIEEYLNGLITGFDNGETVLQVAKAQPEQLTNENEDELTALSLF